MLLKEIFLYDIFQIAILMRFFSERHLLIMINLTKWFNGLLLSTRLMIHMIIWAVLFFIIVSWGLYNKTTLENHFICASNSEHKMYSLGVCMNQSLLSMMNAVDDHIAAKNLNQKNDLEETIAFLKDKITEELATLDSLSVNEKLKDAFKSKLNQWNSVRDRIINLSNNNSIDEARLLFSSDGRELVLLLNTILSSMQSEQKNSSASGYGILETHLHKVSYLCIIVLVLVSVLNLAILVSVYRSIINPLKSIEIVAGKVKNGDYSTRVQFKKSNDELTDLSQVFNGMLDWIEQHEEEHISIEKNMERANQLLKERNLEMEDFVKVVSHDVKSPLTTIEMFTEIVERDLVKNPERALNEVERIRKILNRLRSLIDDLADFALVGTKEEREEQINVTSLFKEVIEDLSYVLVKEPVTEKEGYKALLYELPSKKLMKVILAENIPLIQGDYWKYSQVFLNLLSNAIKFQSDDPLEIKVDGYEEEGFVTVFVKDNGVGVDEEFQKKIFDMCCRLVTYEQVAGTGVGLAIVKKIVDGFGGSIWVKSEGKGKGSAFYIRVPVKKV